MGRRDVWRPTNVQPTPGERSAVHESSPAAWAFAAVVPANKLERAGTVTAVAEPALRKLRRVLPVVGKLFGMRLLSLDDLIDKQNCAKCKVR